MSKSTTETTSYRITQPANGADLGIYAGASEAAALLAMHRDAGYGPGVVTLEPGADDVTFCDDDAAGEYREMCGGVDAYEITEAE